MKNCSFLHLCILLACSVWTLQGRSLQVTIDDDKLGEPVVEAQGLPGICWGCQWALKKVKKMIGPNATAEAIQSKLKVVCNELGLLKSKCQKFVNKYLGVLIEELTTTDDVKTICVNTGACKAKEQLDLIFYPNEEESRRIVIGEGP
ncbi:hypothetical protein CHARACLAT_018864 [Characodon lateralis]|uniref:Saposin B-type domain-containing protein n=1 Tax=Characodon lateralis TaxID=208331 RepID=A0ABU7F4L4_9TELE|nr:hypothetical protein [Characodon lateralis]